MMVNQETIWSLSLDQLCEFYKAILSRNDPAEIRELVLADRFFLLTMVLDVKVAWHPWVLERCREVERDPDEHLDLWSRGHFKSTIITYAGVIQYVLTNPENAVCIMSYKAGAAEAFAGQIKQAFEQNEILNRCFPDILWGEKVKDAPQWSVSDFTIKRKTGRKEATVSTSGLVSGMRTGGHYDLLVYDDTVTPESVTTPEQIQNTTNAWSMSLNLGTLGHTKHWYIGTRYSLFDTYYEMLKTGTIKERRHICVDKWGKPVLLPQEEFDKKKAEMTSRDWNSQMLQQPIGEGELLMQSDWFRTYDRLPDIPMNNYIITDTAQKQGADNDWTVMWAFAYAADRHKYVLDLERDKLPQSKRCDHLFGLVEKWSPRYAFYEENAAPDDKEFITNKMQERGRFNLKMFRQKSNSGSKEKRIETLEPEFREGLWIFPKRLMYKIYDGTWRDLIQVFLNDEFLTYPQVNHDDMLDALASTNHEDVRRYLEYPTFSKKIGMSAVESDIMFGRGGNKAKRGGGLFGR